jgi:hypothetical protein
MALRSSREAPVSIAGLRAETTYVQPETSRMWGRSAKYSNAAFYSLCYIFVRYCTLSQYSVWLRTERPGDRGSILGRSIVFFLWPLCPDRLWGPPSLLYNGYRGVLSSEVSAAGAWRWPLTPIQCRSQEWVGGIRPFPQAPPWRVVGQFFLLCAVDKLWFIIRTSVQWNIVIVSFLYS